MLVLSEPLPASLGEGAEAEGGPKKFCSYFSYAWCHAVR